MGARRRLLTASALSLVALVAVTPVAAASATPRATSTGIFIPAPAPANSGYSPLAKTTNTAMLYSYNWAGYAQSAKKRHTFTSVEDTWTVPAVSTAPPGDQHSADWVGVGGFNRGDRHLIQAGTEQDNIGGTAEYSAWTEILPAASVPLAMAISPGNSITALVEETSRGVWEMQVTDNTTHVTEGRYGVPYHASGKSVEAILEVPVICSPSCAIATLATTSDVTFDPGTYADALQGGPEPLLSPALASEKTNKKDVTNYSYGRIYEMSMVNTSDTAAIATPSAPSANNEGFTVADGATAPPAP